MAADQPRLAVVSAGLSTPSSSRLLADRLAAATGEAMAGKGSRVQTRLFELRDVAHEITDHLLTGFAPPKLAEVISWLTSADGIIVSTPVFTASYSGLFKSFLDILEPNAIEGVPVLLGATAGTERHTLVIDYALRPVFAYLKAHTLPVGVFAASADWGSGDERGTNLQQRVDRAASMLADAMLSRGERRVEDPFDPAFYGEPGRSFSDLLGDH